MGRNVKVMNATIDAALALIGEKMAVTELNAGEFARMKAKGIMKFLVKQYDLEGTGNLSVMTMNMGLMQMSSLVFTPLEKELPLMSLDYMYILGNRKAYLELYDLVEEKTPAYKEGLEKYRGVFKKYDDLQNITATKAWYEHLLTVTAYKAGKVKDDNRLMALLLDAVDVYTDQAKATEVLDEEGKSKKKTMIKAYSDRLIDEGGISTDFFKKSFGADFTRSFFDRVFFGTDR